MWYKLDVAPPPVGQWFAPLALWAASGNLASGKETMRSEVVRSGFSRRNVRLLLCFAAKAAPPATSSSYSTNEGHVSYEPHLDAALRFLLDGIFWLLVDVELMLRIGRVERGRVDNGA